jgi:hypothetical protein
MDTLLIAFDAGKFEFYSLSEIPTTKLNFLMTMRGGTSYNLLRIPCTGDLLRKILELQIEIVVLPCGNFNSSVITNQTVSGLSPEIFKFLFMYTIFTLPVLGLIGI